MLKIISIFLILLGIAFILRIIPSILSPAGMGVDHWYWKKYIETLRRTRIFPPVLPQYLLDQYQWYPPLFPLLMVKIPSRVFDRWNHLLAIGIDLFRMTLLLLIACLLTNKNLIVIMLSGIIYATTPIQISYNFQLNPRGLAALFLDILLILLLSFYSYHAPWYIWIIVIGLSGLILLTHKMTTQLFWFICFCCSIIYKDLRVLMLIPFSIITAILFSRGFYIKVLIAHIDIVRFWKKNWRWIGADAIKESPIYGSKNYQRKEKLHKTGFRGVFWYCFLLFGFNPACWIACLLIFERMFISPHAIFYSSWLIFWLLIPCLLALLTTFIPILRCIGAGYLYLYNTSLITSLLLAMAFQYSKATYISTPIYFLAILFNTCGIISFYRKFFRNKRARIDVGFNKVLEKLKELPIGNVLCIPSSWHEPIAYKTSHSVVWGAHGYGFKLLTSTWPRIMKPMNEIIEQYKINYLLTTQDQLTVECLNHMPKKTQLLQIQDYQLYIFP